MEWFGERTRTPYQASVREKTSTAYHDEPTGAEDEREHVAAHAQPPPDAAHKHRRYRPRTCRICLDVVEPRYPSNASQSSRPMYMSDDPELGRLLSPCKCKGSQKYVHEGCLNSWRLSNPTVKRNYWQCPTCKFSYRLVRLHWASMLSSKWAQAGLTLFLLAASIFVLGFLADPILGLWVDPVGTVSDAVTSVVTDIEALKSPDWEPPTTWGEHFLKGFFSLGLVGIFKSMLAVSPWHWWNLRSLTGTGRRQGSGRARVENISLVFVIIGALTALMGIWKGVKKLSERVLKNVSERVLDVGADDGDVDEDFDEGNSSDAKKNE
ncbi:zinc finger protein [Trichoderma cornu-damae]|uniref:Zinc finger protein n=1 Tax=Trichoderma cornu-damae TaxID=654480 RepID=A0A9P8QJW5_9HYPO|nr:zinc finger protein [Trichoderma cornu-damae]